MKQWGGLYGHNTSVILSINTRLCKYFYKGSNPSQTLYDTLVENILNHCAPIAIF